MNPAQIQATADGAILFDPACAAQADAAWFDVDAWRARGAAERAGAGRGDAWFIAAPWGESVLRHYRRGGLVANLLDDTYLWTGADHTRCFVEFRLLEALYAKGLPVPRPLAARYVKSGLRYRADLITRRIEQGETLATRLRAGQADASALTRVGETIADFHAAGAFHADLNAHNVLLDRERVWLIDFDRGEWRVPWGAWCGANLARLKRSLQKVLGDAQNTVEAAYWPPLQAGYERRRTQLTAAERRA